MGGVGSPNNFFFIRAESDLQTFRFISSLRGHNFVKKYRR